MAFSTLRGRPKSRPPETDPGTPELRLKHALGVTSEPIDLCLAKSLITPEQHRSGLHLRWLYTLRYGAPVLTTRYADRVEGLAPPPEDPHWRTLREREYHEAIALLQTWRCYEPVLRLAIFNERPAFLNPRLQQRAFREEALAEALSTSLNRLREGLEILTLHWRRSRKDATGGDNLPKMSP